MENSAYRTLLSEIYSRETREKTAQEKLIEGLCNSFETLQKLLVSQDPSALPTALQLAITASPSFPTTNAFCDFEDFEPYGGWASFYVQSEVMKLFTSHDCQNCKTGSLRGCLICLTWIAFSGYDMMIDTQKVEMNSSRYNGFSNAVEGIAGPGKVELDFKSKTEEPIGCAVKT
jgi:hypothetical protein